MGGTAATIGGSALGGAFGGKGGEKQSQTRNEATNSISRNQSSNQSSSSSAPWEAQIPYLLEMFSRGRGMLDTAPAGNPLNQDAAAQIKKTLGGDYLFGNPESKKAIDAITEQTTNRVMPGIDSKFAASGRYGSGLHKQELGRQIADTSTSEMAKNYNAERNNMMGAATAAPGVANSLDWKQQRLKDFNSLISGNYGGTTTGSSNSIMNSIMNSTGMSTMEGENPNNKLTGKIGGAMGGANIARKIVGGNAGAGGVPGAKLPTPRFGSGK